MHKEAKEELDVRFKIVVLDPAEHFGVTKTRRDFKVPRSTFYRWKKKYDQEGSSGLYRKKPIADSHPHRKPPKVVGKLPKTAPKPRCIPKGMQNRFQASCSSRCKVFTATKNSDGKTVKCYQYTAVDDARRIRAFQIFSKHN